jgi:type III pantothenate kinase
MKVLLLDAGNTRVKWAVVDMLEPGSLLSTGSCGYGSGGFPERLARQWAGLPPVDRVLLSCVAGAPVSTVIADAVRDDRGLAVEVLRPERACAGVTNGYDDPGQLGIDRWLALLGGRRLAGAAPAWIVDCGTAVTVDYLDRHGAHRGGLILPGLAMMREGLSTATAALGDTAASHAGRVIPEPLVSLARDTDAAVTGGTMIGIVASLDRIVADFAADNQVVRIITGGDSPVIAPHLDGRWFVRPNLVLEGMAVYIEESA